MKMELFGSKTDKSPEQKFSVDAVVTLGNLMTMLDSRMPKLINKHFDAIESYNLVNRSHPVNGEERVWELLLEVQTKNDVQFVLFSVDIQMDGNGKVTVGMKEDKTVLGDNNITAGFEKEIASLVKMYK